MATMPGGCAMFEREPGTVCQVPPVFAVRVSLDGTYRGERRACTVHLGHVTTAIVADYGPGALPRFRGQVSRFRGQLLIVPL